MGARNILYLTSSNTGHPQVYRAHISWRGREVVLDHEPFDTNTSIIDLDEAEACILLLRGFRLFKVEVVECRYSHNYPWLAIVDDIDAVIEWERETFYS